MSTFKDSTGRTWTRAGTSCKSDDGRVMAIVPAMTDAYLLSVIDAPAVPAEVTMAQARLALLQARLLVGVETAIDGMAEPARTAAKIEWEYRPTVHRQSALVLQLAGILGLTGAQLDALFIAAAAL